MDAETQNLLYLIGEISIATVALSGITMVLAVSALNLDDARSGQIATQLRMAFIVVASAVLPLVLFELTLRDALLWRVASALYLCEIVYVVARGIARAEGYGGLPPRSARLVMIAGAGALTLLPLNLWLAESWPYVAQLFIGWSVSMGLFIRFVYEALSENRANAGRDDDGG